MGSDDSAIEPRILTLWMDEESQARFDRLRRSFFPKTRNVIPAHLTLFHKLPGDREAKISADLSEVCGRHPPISLKATGLRFLGSGVAYELVSPELEEVRERLAERWEPWLGAQDRQRFKPHVTVQNKVPAEKARALYERLSASFLPFEVGAEGLLLWRYLGGPWEPVGEHRFGR